MRGGGGSIQIARLFGIRIGVTTSWFVVLFFFIFVLSGSFRNVLDSSDGVAYLTAVASARSTSSATTLPEPSHTVPIWMSR